MRNKITKGISYHFEREAKIMAGLIFAIILLSMVAALIGPWILSGLDLVGWGITNHHLELRN